MKRGLSITGVVFIVLIAAAQSYRIWMFRDLNDTYEDVMPYEGLDKIKERFGAPIYSLTEPIEILHFGSIKDEQFLKDKNLYLFRGKGIPLRFLEIYTTKDNHIIFIKTQKM